jgi:hypothetical protein
MRRDCIATEDNEFGFVLFFGKNPSGKLRHSQARDSGDPPMFAVPRSAAAVLLPLAMLVAVALWTNRDADSSSQLKPSVDQTVAANLPSR